MPRLQHVRLAHRLGLGDVVLVTALVRDLKLAQPALDISVETSFKPVWEHNPNVSQLKRAASDKRVLLEYSAAISEVRSGRRKTHFLRAFYDDFRRKTGIDVPLTKPHGDLHLSPEEQQPWVEGRYWVVIAGGANNITTKQWPYGNYQAVVDDLREHGIPCVQAGAVDRASEIRGRHIHPPLSNTLDLVGKTDIRDLFTLISQADGVICGVTGAMHIAACFQKPCVVVAGGREPWFWEAYDNRNLLQRFGPACSPVSVEHVFLDVPAELPCTSPCGCWKKRTVPLEPKDVLSENLHRLCEAPQEIDGAHFPACMPRITPDKVVESVLSYYAKGILMPFEFRTPPTVRYLGDPEPAPRVLRPPKVVKEVKPISRTPNVPLRSSSLAAKRSSDPHKIFDHPFIGGKFTVCVLCYGDYPQLAKKCLTGILQTLPADRMDLRIGLNAVCPETLEFVRSLPATKVYHHEENAYKYPVMREMFHDPECPIATPYLVWFDDDTYPAKPSWSVDLATTIAQNHNRDCRLYGWKMYHDTSIYQKEGNQPLNWFREATWDQKRPYLSRRTRRPDINGSVIPFVPGWFWAIATDVVREVNMPDLRLQHNGGDILNGAAVFQAGYRIKEFNTRKKYITCPDKASGGRRGWSQAFPWANAQTKANHVPGT